MPWSPSSTEKFLSCPMKWWLDRKGAIGRARDESAMEQGSAFHAAMAAHWTLTPNPAEGQVLRALTLTMDEHEAALREEGVVCVECVLGGEADEIARHGRYPGTADLVTQNAHGLTVTDYKTKNTLQPAYVHGELIQTRRSWQFKQYAWFVQEKYGRPVTHVRKLLVAFKPTLRVWLESCEITQQELSDWHASAMDVWYIMDQMELGELDAWRNADTCVRYGWDYRCDHYETCWDGQPIEYKESAQ